MSVHSVTFDSFQAQSVTRVITTNTIPYSDFTKFTAYMEGRNASQLQYDFVGYDSNGTEVVDLYWYDSGTEITIPTGNNIATWRLWFRYSNNGSISPSDITLCTAEYKTIWHIGDDGFPYNEDAPTPAPPIEAPYPLGLWRITWDVPDLYHELLPDVVHSQASPVRQREYICAYDYHTLKTEFDGHGLGVLRPTSCLITEELNGNYELTLEHPIDSEGRWEWIQENNLIKALGQIFTIKTVQVSYKGSVGKVKAKAVHVFYQLNDWWIRRGAHLVGQSVNALMASAAAFTEKHSEIGDTSYTFGFSSDVPVPNWTIGYEKWKDLENGMTPNEFLLGNDGVIANCGGELYRDNFRFSINQAKENSKENAFEIRVGKNLKGIERVIDLTTMVTYFQGYDNWGNWFAISWNADMTHFNIPHHVTRGKTYRYEFDDTYFATIPYEEQAAQLLQTDVTREFKANCSPIISYTIDIEEVRDNPDYTELTGFSEYKVGNTGYIVDERLKERIGLKITRTVTDAITGNVKTVVFGDRRSLVSHPNYNTAITDLEPLPIAISFQILDSSGALVFDAEGAAIIQEEEVS